MVNILELLLDESEAEPETSPMTDRTVEAVG